MKKSKFGVGIFYIISLIIIGVLAYAIIGNAAEPEEVSYSTMIQHIKAENVVSVEVDRGDQIAVATLKNDNQIYCVIALHELDALLAEYIEPGGIDVEYKVPGDGSWISIIIALATLGLIIFIAYSFMSRQSGENSRVMNFGKSKAKMYTVPTKKVTFEDVAGADEEKEEVSEIVDFLKSPKKYSKLGARIPKGALLVGAPGTGKTLLARAVAGEAGVPFFSVSGSTFVEMFVGVGASRVRDLFDNAKKNSPCIVFIDEIDAVGRRRGAGLGGGNDEREQTLNQLLVEMDGFAENQGIVVMAATNRPDVLDPALQRPGRFDRQIFINLPDLKGREAILNVHIKGKIIDESINLKTLAKGTVGFTGADLENLLNEAALLAARLNKEKIEMDDLQEAIKRIIAGPAKRSRIVTDDDKRITAYHEAGHAIVMNALPKCNEVHEISIIPRGMAAGYTIGLPDNEDDHITKQELNEKIAGLLGGRAAEKLALDDITTGASSDIERATRIARRMVVRFGMSDKLGPLVYSTDEDEIFIGRDFGKSRNYSEEVAAAIDKEIRLIIEKSFDVAYKILEENRDKLELITKTLLEKESIDGKEFKKLIGQEKKDKK